MSKMYDTSVKIGGADCKITALSYSEITCLSAANLEDKDKEIIVNVNGK